MTSCLVHAYCRLASLLLATQHIAQYHIRGNVVVGSLLMDHTWCLTRFHERHYLACICIPIRGIQRSGYYLVQRHALGLAPCPEALAVPPLTSRMARPCTLPPPMQHADWVLDYLARGVVILTNVALGAGIVFLIGLLGVLWALPCRREEGNFDQGVQLVHSRSSSISTPPCVTPSLSPMTWVSSSTKRPQITGSRRQY